MLQFDKFIDTKVVHWTFCMCTFDQLDLKCALTKCPVNNTRVCTRIDTLRIAGKCRLQRIMLAYLEASWGLFLRPLNYLLEEWHRCSVGKRACPGEVLAVQELFLFISAIVQQFDILPPEGETSIRDEMKFVRLLSPAPFEVRFVPRAQSSEWRYRNSIEKSRFCKNISLDSNIRNC